MAEGGKLDEEIEAHLQTLGVPIDLPPYHPHCPLATRSGYYPNISKEQHEAVLRLRDLLSRQVDESGTSFYSQFQHDDENEYLRSLRFLRARKFDVTKAYAMVTADIAWRADKLMLRRRTSVEVLGCDSQSMYAFFPTWMQGFDKQQRPVSYRQFGKFEISKVLQLTSMDKLIRFHAWETEAAVRLSLERSRSLGYNLETFVLVVDAAGWSLKLATGEAFTFIKGMASTDSDHYPERLGTMLLINAPSVLSFAWRIIQTFLDDVTKSKIKIMGTDPKEWQPVLFDLIDRDQVPCMYGGLAPDPTAETAFATMDPRSDTGESAGGDDRCGSSGSVFAAPTRAEEVMDEASLRQFLKSK